LPIKAPTSTHRSTGCIATIRGHAVPHMTCACVG
jgi:hypothetical protein